MQSHGNLTGYVCPGASFRNFYYLLSRAPSIFINLFSYMLYFTLYYLLFVNCSLLVSFFPCVYVRKSGVVCTSTVVFLVFLLLVYIAETHYSFSVFFTFLGRIAMQGIECDLLLLV